jgi:DNA polymerase-3 subunit delta'
MFSDVIGHSEVIKNLKNAIASGRLANGYIFAGPDEVGKEFLAVSFAKALNCKELVGDFCDKCVSCRRINDGNHTDVSIISPDGAKLKIEQMRFLKKQSSYKSLESKHKIYIIRDADKMTPESANSMLKTLEEPSGVVLFILLTTVYNSLLPTIRSRCQLVRFSLVSQEILQRGLIERLGISDSEANLLAINSHGKPGRAIKLAKHDTKKTNNDLSLILSVLTQKNRANLLEIFKKAEEINKIDSSIDNIISWYRDLLLVKNGCQESILTHRNEFSRLQEISESYSVIEIENLIKMSLNIKNLIERNINPVLAIEVMLFNASKSLSTRL